MQGQINIPTFYATRWIDDYKHLLAMVQSHYKFKLEYSDNPVVNSNSEVMILFATPHHMRPDNLLNMARLDKSIKLIGFMKDIQHYGDPKVEEAYKMMFDRYDIILSSANELFRKLYPEYVEKMVYFPDFFGPYERYNLPYNDNPIMKCLVTGTVNNVYPLRSYILQNGNEKYLDYLPNRSLIHDEYAQFLNKYFCSATCSSVFKYTLAKYFEIPASGALLIADETEDLKSLGFIPNKHYVPITKETAIPTIEACIEHPGNYESIRMQGMDFVRTNHSIYNRFEQMKGIIDGMS